MLDGCVSRTNDEIESYRDRGLWEGVTLGRFLTLRAQSGGADLALVGGTARYSYLQLDMWVSRLAAGLVARGICAGDRVVVQLPNVPEFVALCFALFRVGALPVFALPSFRKHELQHLCNCSGARALVIPSIVGGVDHRKIAVALMNEAPDLEQVFVMGDPERFVALSDVDADPVELPDPDPSDVAFFLLSGGTTALPKLVPRTHDDYLYQARITAKICSLDESTVYLAVLPVEFNFPWGCPGIIGTLHAGGTAVLARHPSPDECFALIAREGVTLTSVVPTVLHTWLDAAGWMRPDLSSLRMLQVGSAKLHRDVAEQVTPTIGCRLQQVFGMAEGLLTFTRDGDTDDVVLGTQGRPVSPYDEVRVCDPHGAEVPTGEIGELVTRGPYTLRGYYRAAEHNATAFTADGFYRSGDLVRLTADGNMMVEGRIKDVIIRGGDKVSATEVESHLTSNEHVEQAAVVAMPDPVMGERTCAFVVPVGPPPTLAALRAFMRDRGVADYKLPDRVVVVDAFPLTGLGKVDKKALAVQLTVLLAER